VHEAVWQPDGSLYSLVGLKDSVRYRFLSTTGARTRPEIFNAQACGADFPLPQIAMYSRTGAWRDGQLRRGGSFVLRTV
jgi:hypothetical protein